MLIVRYAQEVSSRGKDRRNRTHVDHSLTCSEEKFVSVHVSKLVRVFIIVSQWAFYKEPCKTVEPIKMPFG